VQHPPAKRRKSPKELAFLERQKREARRESHGNYAYHSAPLADITVHHRNKSHQNGYHTDSSRESKRSISQDSMARSTKNSKKAASGINPNVASLPPRDPQQDPEHSDSDEEGKTLSPAEADRILAEMRDLQAQLKKAKEQGALLKRQIAVTSSEVAAGKVSMHVVNKIKDVVGQVTFYKYQSIPNLHVEENITRSVYKRVYSAEEKKTHSKDFPKQWVSTYRGEVRKALNTIRNNKQSSLKNALAAGLMQLKDGADFDKELPKSDDIAALLICDFDMNEPKLQKQYIWVVDVLMSKVCGVGSWSTTHRRFTTVSKAEIQTDKPVSFMCCP
jgi:hypothetical protein